MSSRMRPAMLSGMSPPRPPPTSRRDLRSPTESRTMRPLSLVFSADTPGVEDVVGDVFDGFVLERGEGHEGELGSGGLLDAGGVAFEFGFALGRL